MKDKKILLEARINRLSGTEKNQKCPGVLKKLNRKLLKLSI